MGDSLKEILASELAHLKTEDQHKVLEFVRSLPSGQVNIPASTSVLDFAGSLPKEDADKMIKVIEDGCERIDHGGW
jgi:hypothetical protein